MDAGDEGAISIASSTRDAMQISENGSLRTGDAQNHAVERELAGKIR